ncbi:hypothetical protein [Tepidimicrobium xylanilyticum]
MKIINKGGFIWERGLTIGEYIQREYDIEIIVNIRKIWSQKTLTKNMKLKLNTWDKESRSNERFFLDTISGWVGQDYILDEVLLKSPIINDNYFFQRGGTDAKRKITRADETGIETDIIAFDVKTGEKIYLEVMEDNTGYMKRTNKFDLRWRQRGTRSKYSDLMDLWKKGFETYVVILDVQNNGIIFVPIQETKVDIWKYRNPAYEGRLCTKLITDYKKHFKSFKDLGIIA